MTLDGVYKLHVVSGADAGETVALSGSSIKLVGGSTTALNENEGFLSIKDSSIGGLQAVLNWDKEQNIYKISNRSAFSPIVVNGKACAHALLVNGTTIAIGNSVLQVEAPEGCQEQTNAKVCEITSNVKEEAVYLGAPPAEQSAKSFTPAWLRRGEDAPELPALSMEHVTSDSYVGHHEALLGAMSGSLSADDKAHIYAPASRAGRPPGPQPRSLVDPDIDSAQQLGIDLALYKQAKAAGFDPILYTQAYQEGIDPYVYMQACQDGQDPHLYAQAYSLGLEPQAYIEALNKGYESDNSEQVAGEEVAPVAQVATTTSNQEYYEDSNEPDESEGEGEADFADFEPGSEGGFGHLFTPPPSFNIEEPVAFQVPEATSDIVEDQPIDEEDSKESETTPETESAPSVEDQPITSDESSGNSTIVPEVESTPGIEAQTISTAGKAEELTDALEFGTTSIGEAQTIVDDQGSVNPTNVLPVGKVEGAEDSSAERKYEVVSAPEEPKDGQRPKGRLVVVYGPDRGLTLDVYGNVTIGRAKSNDLVLHDLSISRQHCSVQFLEDGIYLVNHSTSSTTKVGRMPIKRRARLTKENSITLANKVRIHWESYV